MNLYGHRSALRSNHGETAVNETDSRDAHTDSGNDRRTMYPICIFALSIVIIHRGDVEILYRFLLRILFVI